MKLSVKKMKNAWGEIRLMCRLEGEPRYDLELPYYDVMDLAHTQGWRLSRTPSRFEITLKKPEGDSVRLTRAEHSNLRYVPPDRDEYNNYFESIWFCPSGLDRVFGDRRRPRYIYIRRLP